MTTKKPPVITTVDHYLATLGSDQRAALQRVRTIITTTIPGIEEGISYRMPVFRLDGRWLVWIGAAARHCALYGIVGIAAKELAKHDTSGRGTLRFTPDKPLPAALIRRIVKARAAGNAARLAKAKARRPAKRSR